MQCAGTHQPKIAAWKWDFSSENLSMQGPPLGFFQKKNRDDKGREKKIRKTSNVSVTHLLISFVQKPKRILREIMELKRTVK